MRHVVRADPPARYRRFSRVAPGHACRPLKIDAGLGSVTHYCSARFQVGPSDAAMMKCVSALAFTLYLISIGKAGSATLLSPHRQLSSQYHPSIMVVSISLDLRES